MRRPEAPRDRPRPLAERALLPVRARRPRSSPTRSASSPRCCRPTAPPRWRSVCGSTLSLMDAGVPIKAPVAGIAMGLVYADGKYTTLTDILGAEDAFGDMDFKVAGTAEFVTALQLDTKIDGIPADVLAAGAAAGQGGPPRRSSRSWHGAIAEPRAEVGATAPKIVSFEIPIDKIGEVIGPEGQGHQRHPAGDRRRHLRRRRRHGRHGQHRLDRRRCGGRGRAPDRAHPRPAHRRGRRQVYTGQVVNITKFGAFVNILPGRDGLLHISKIGGGKRIDRVEDVLDLGDEIEVRVDDIDPNGKVSLSLASAPAAAEGESVARRRPSRPWRPRRPWRRRPGRVGPGGRGRQRRRPRVRLVRGRLRRRDHRRVRRPRSGRRRPWRREPWRWRRPWSWRSRRGGGRRR